MKKILIFICASLLTGSCDNDEKYLFGTGPDERLQETITKYQDMLCNAPYGWLVAVGTQSTHQLNGGAYRLWMKFSSDNRVTMCSDQSDIAAVTPQTSSYRIKAMLFPTLMFDTYNYLHVMADPAVLITGGTSGSGLYSDFDFEFRTTITGNEDEFVLTGRFNDCPIVFKKATQQEAEAVTEGTLIDIKTTVASYWDTMLYPSIDIGGFIVQMGIGSRLVMITYKEAEGTIQTVMTPAYTEFNRDVRLMVPFVYENVAFDRLVWNGTKYVVNVLGNNYDVYDHGMPSYPFEFGIDQPYTLLRVSESQLNNAAGKSMVDPFLNDVWNAMYNAVLTLPRFIDYFTVAFGRDATSNPQMTLTFSYSNATGTIYLAYAYYRINTESDGTVYFTNMQTTAGNMNTIGPSMAENILSFFLYEGTGLTGANSNIVVPASGNKFMLDWAPNMTPGLSATLGGFYVVSNPSCYMPGIPGN